MNGKRVTSFVLVETPAKRTANLGHDERRGHKKGRNEGDLNRQVERLGDRQESLTGRMDLTIGSATSLKILLGKEPARGKRDPDRDQHVDDASPQFLEMIEERHLTAKVFVLFFLVDFGFGGYGH